VLPTTAIDLVRWILGRGLHLDKLSLSGPQPAWEVAMSDQALIMADSEGVIRAWNSGAEVLFGYDAASAIGQTLDLVIPPEYREHHWRGFRAAMQGDNLAIDRASVNVPVLSRNGTHRLAVRLLVLRDAKQRIAGALAIFAPDDDPASPLPRL
jgi:PAS domain S-box-containing protein